MLQLHYLPRTDAELCVLLVVSKLQLGSQLAGRTRRTEMTERKVEEAW